MEQLKQWAHLSSILIYLVLTLVDLIPSGFLPPSLAPLYFARWSSSHRRSAIRLPLLLPRELTQNHPHPLCIAAPTSSGRAGASLRSSSLSIPASNITPCHIYKFGLPPQIEYSAIESLAHKGTGGRSIHLPGRSCRACAKMRVHVGFRPC
jgi:hypothetical protein